MVTMQIGVYKTALVGGWRQVLVNLLDEKLGKRSPASVTGGAAGAEGTDDVAMPDRFIRTAKLVDLAQQCAELAGDDALPVAGQVAHLPPRCSFKPRRHDVWP